jgi:hypothetical protein
MDVIPRLVPGIQQAARAGVSGRLDPGDKRRDDRWVFYLTGNIGNRRPRNQLLLDRATALSAGPNSQSQQKES